MENIKWHFAGTQIYFISTPENFENDVRKNRNKLGLLPSVNPKIINQHGNNPTTTSSDHTSIDSNPVSEVIQTLSVGSKRSKTSRKTSDGLLGMSRDVDSTTTSVNPLEDSISDSSSSSSSDSVVD